MTQIDHLKVVYEVEDARYRASMNQMRQLSSQTSRDLVRNAEKAESSLKSMRGNIQNFAFQAQDVAVQISAGTSAAQALGQQLPQLLGGFGVLGAVMGAVVAIGIPLAANFLGIGEEAEDRVDVAAREHLHELGDDGLVGGLCAGRRGAHGADARNAPGGDGTSPSGHRWRTAQPVPHPVPPNVAISPPSTGTTAPVM